jgi:hypothetical protein
MYNNISGFKIADVEKKYSHLEDYMKDYIDNLAYNAKRRLITFYYLKHHGILLTGENIYEQFPTYEKWMFYRMWKVTPFSFSS